MGFSIDDNSLNKVVNNKETKSEEQKVSKKALPNAKVVEQEEILEPIPEVLANPIPVLTADKLPSEFKLYPNGEETKIIYNPYTWAGTRKLNSSDMPTRQLWEFILSGIETERNLPKYKITVADFYYLAFLRRLATVGYGKFTVEVDCYNELPDTGKRCNHKNNFEIDDKEIEFDNMPLNKEDFPVYLKIDDNTELELSPTVIQDAFILMTKNKYSDPIAQIAVQIRNMKFDDAYNLLNSEKMNGVIGAELDRIIEQFHHRVQPIFKPCKGCGQTVAVILDMGGTIIKPFREHSDDERLRVRYGKVGE